MTKHMPPKGGICLVILSISFGIGRAQPGDSIPMEAARGAGPTTSFREDSLFSELACWQSLGIKADGRIVLWGRVAPDESATAIPAIKFTILNGNDESTPTIASCFSEIALAGPDSDCCAPFPFDREFVMVAIGEYHSLGLKTDGSIEAWGYNYCSQCSIPSPNSGFVAIAAGYEHSLGLKADGAIVAWGSNDQGQCDVPSPDSDFVGVVAPRYHTCRQQAQVPEPTVVPPSR